MRWKDFTIIGLLLFLFLTLFLLRKLNQERNQIINQLKLQVDSLQRVTTKSVVEYRERKVTNTKIVDRWNNVYSVDSFTSIDTLFLQAKSDINYLDTSLKKCDTALFNCEHLVSKQHDLLKVYAEKKQPIFVPYLGVGLSYNTNIQPAFQLGIGLNLNKLRGK